jgi:hypothetical protein
LQLVIAAPGKMPQYVGSRRDRSTAVIGGNSPIPPRLLGILHSEELPQGLYGSPRANALAAIDRRYNHNALIVADLSYDPTYISLERIELLGPFSPSLTLGHLIATAQIPSNCVARPSCQPRQTPDATPVLLQNHQFHLLLRLQHRPLPHGGTT